MLSDREANQASAQAGPELSSAERTRRPSLTALSARGKSAREVQPGKCDGD